MPHGPHVRTPTHRRPHFWERRKAYYRLRRAHPWPGGFCTRGMTDEVSCSYRILTPFRPALPGRTEFPNPLYRRMKALGLTRDDLAAAPYHDYGSQRVGRYRLLEECSGAPG